MKLYFEPELDYQLAAIAAVNDLFRGQEICRTEFTVTKNAVGGAIARMLIESGRLEDFKRNPQQFVELAAQVIGRAKQLAIVDGIKYQRLGEDCYYAQELFEQEEPWGAGHLARLLISPPCHRDPATSLHLRQPVVRCRSTACSRRGNDEMTEDERTVSNTEMEVLKVLWEIGAGTVREIDAVLRKRRRRWAYTTVLTLLTRLQAKGYVESDKSGLAHVFRPTVSRDKLLRRRLGRLVDDVCEGTAAPLVHALIEGRRFSPDEIERFRRLLDDLAPLPEGSVKKKRTKPPKA